MKYSLLVVIGGMSVFAASASSARTWHILPDSTGEAPTIQTGIDSAGIGDTVLVACGTYYEHGIALKSGIMLRSETGDASCVTIDAEQLDHVAYGDSLDASTSVVGFTFTNGEAPGLWPDQRGGGMYLSNSYLEITSCSFEENSAEYGGGGVCCESSSPVLTGCRFISNHVQSWGGGIMNHEHSSPTVTDCVFEGNSSDNAGGAIFTNYGHPVISGCVFEGNSASYGGSLANNTGSQPEITGCIFVGNEAQTGGGVSNWGCQPVMSSCTFYRNSADFAGAAVHNDYTWTTLENCLIAYSLASQPVTCDGHDCGATLICCDVYGNAEGDWVGCLEGQCDTLGNFSACPSFCHAQLGDLHLCDESPCLPGNHPYGYDCELIGALGQGCSCGPTRNKPTTWGAIKAIHR